MAAFHRHLMAGCPDKYALTPNFESSGDFTHIKALLQQCEEDYDMFDPLDGRKLHNVLTLFHAQTKTSRENVSTFSINTGLIPPIQTLIPLLSRQANKLCQLYDFALKRTKQQSTKCIT